MISGKNPLLLGLAQDHKSPPAFCMTQVTRTGVTRLRGRGELELSQKGIALTLHCPDNSLRKDEPVQWLIKG